MENLKKIRKARGLTQKELAKLSDLSEAQISLIESGKRFPSYEALLKLAEALDCESADLLSTRNTPTITTNVVTFPVIGEVAAHYGHFGDQNYTNGEVEIPESWLKGRDRKEFFVLRVSGDSMYPDYQDGDIVLVHSQPVLDRNGQVAVVRYNSEEATLKRVDHGAGSVKLCPINPQYPPLTIRGNDLHSAEFAILGIPKMIIRSVE